MPYLLIDLCCDKGSGGELLLAQQALHILAQHLAGIERQRPDANHENHQREQSYPGFERAPLKDVPDHANAYVAGGGGVACWLYSTAGLADALPGVLAMGFLVAMKIPLREIDTFMLPCYAYPNARSVFFSAADDGHLRRLDDEFDLLLGVSSWPMADRQPRW